MKRLVEIMRELEEIRDREAVRLWRLSRRAAAHGCSMGLCVRIREEGWRIRKMNPEDLLNPFHRWDFAFKGGLIMEITVRALLALMDENERVGVFSRIRGFASAEDHLYRAWDVLECVDPSILDAPVRSISRSLYDRINIEIE